GRTAVLAEEEDRRARRRHGAHAALRRLGQTPAAQATRQEERPNAKGPRLVGRGPEASTQTLAPREDTGGRSAGDIILRRRFPANHRRRIEPPALHAPRLF